MTRLAVGLAVLVFALGAALWWFGLGSARAPQAAGGVELSPPKVMTSGGIGLRYSESEYAIATSPAHITVSSFIPPCDEGFDYCIYDKGSAYGGTTFESAGLRVKERKDLTTESSCLKSPPTGYADLAPTLRYAGDGFTTTVFYPLEGAATGHSSKAALYRLSFEKTCYEFETRVGRSNVDNYEKGTVKAFTEGEMQNAFAGLREILEASSIGANKRIIFPTVRY